MYGKRRRRGILHAGRVKNKWRMRCRYEPFLVAEAPLGSSDPASDGGAAFRTLAGYLFGGNAAGERMAMTAPVISSTSGVMQFYVGGGRQARRPCFDVFTCSAHDPKVLMIPRCS